MSGPDIRSFGGWPGLFLADFVIPSGCLGHVATVASLDLSDFEWSVIEPLLPTKVRGVPRVDDRR